MSQPASISSKNALKDFAPTLFASNWKWVKLGDHVRKIGSGITPRGGHASYLRSGIPLIRSQNVHMNRFEEEGLAFISPQQDEAMEGSRVQAGDVLLNITGASIGRVCVVPSEMCPANVNQHVSIIRSDGSFVPEFLSYFISHPEIQKQILDSQAGATRQALTKVLIENFSVPLPPLSEQKHIVSILKEQMAAADRARAAAEAQLNAAKDLPVAYLRAVFESEDARRWLRKQLNELGELLPAKSVATEGDTQVTAITTACLTESGFQPSGVKTARMSAKDADVCKVGYGEILLARSNTPDLVGRAAMFSGEPENAVASDLTIRFLPYSVDISPFLAAYLSFLYITGYWKERAGGASGSMKKITRPQVLQLSVPVPSVEERSKLVGALSEQMQSSKRLISALSKQVNDIKQLPATLLRQAFTGKL